MEENKVVTTIEETKEEKKETLVSKAKGFVTKHGKKVLIGAGIVGAFVVGLAAGKGGSAIDAEWTEVADDESTTTEE